MLNNLNILSIKTHNLVIAVVLKRVVSCEYKPHPSIESLMLIIL